MGSIRRLALAIGSMLALASCATMESTSNRLAIAIMNKPVQNAVDTLGLPYEEKTVVGRRIVVWRTGGGRVNDYSCQVTAEIDKSEIVRNYEIDGAIGSCLSWLRDIK